MGFGIAFSGFAWIVAGAIQLAIDGGDAVSITCQVLPYVLLTFGEVLVSAAGLEFAYSQAPLSMKGAINGVLVSVVTVGNLGWLLVYATDRATCFCIGGIPSNVQIDPSRRLSRTWLGVDNTSSQIRAGLDHLALKERVSEFSAIDVREMAKFE
jgi:hypothetical protein